MTSGTQVLSMVPKFQNCSILNVLTQEGVVLVAFFIILTGLCTCPIPLPPGTRERGDEWLRLRLNIERRNGQPGFTASETLHPLVNSNLFLET